MHEKGNWKEARNSYITLEKDGSVRCVCEYPWRDREDGAARHRE